MVAERKLSSQVEFEQFSPAQPDPRFELISGEIVEKVPTCEHGARMVWLVYPDKRLVEVLTPDTRDLLGEGETISGGEVLPGFTLPVREVFRRV